MMDYEDRLPRTAHMFTMALAHLNSSLNPFLYALFNPSFRRGYKMFLRKIIILKGLVSEQNNEFNSSSYNGKSKTANNSSNRMNNTTL